VAFVDYVLEPDKPGRSGLSDTIWDMASELVNQGHEAHVIASYSTTEYPDRRVFVHNVSPPPMAYRNLIGQIWLLLRLSKVVRKNQFDIIHTREYPSIALFSVLGIKTPLVLTVPGNIYQRIKLGHGYEWWYVYYLKWAARIAAKKSAKIIATSIDMKHWWEWTGSHPDDTLWIPLGIDESRFYFIQDAREILKIPPDKLIFLYVGRFSKEKGVLDLVEAINMTKNSFDEKNVTFYLIGKGPQQAEINARILNLNLGGVIKVIDWVPQDQLPLWYSASNAVLMPSWNEPFGKVMLEAMACGIPVIATATGGLADLIVNGVNGFLFEAHAIQKLSIICSKIISNPGILHEMRATTSKPVQEKFTWKHIMERIIDEVYFPLLISSYSNSSELHKSIINDKTNSG
jgi:glycogen(starch) synthase